MKRRSWLIAVNRRVLFEYFAALRYLRERTVVESPFNRLVAQH